VSTKRIASAILASLAIMACYYPPARQSSYGVSGNPGPFSSFEHKAEYQEYEYLVARENAAANAQMRSPNYSNIPGGGYIMVTLKGVTLELAKPENHLFILRDKHDVEIKRERGRPSVPNFTLLSASSLTEWWDVAAIFLAEPIYDTTHLYVVNTVFNNSKRFTFYPKYGIQK
jgi:hypothetical protein